jgi:hypothetical protein
LVNGSAIRFFRAVDNAAVESIATAVVPGAAAGITSRRSARGEGATAPDEVYGTAVRPFGIVNSWNEGVGTDRTGGRASLSGRRDVGNGRRSSSRGASGAGRRGSDDGAGEPALGHCGGGAARNVDDGDASGVAVSSLAGRSTG